MERWDGALVKHGQINAYGGDGWNQRSMNTTKLKYNKLQ